MDTKIFVPDKNSQRTADPLRLYSACVVSAKGREGMNLNSKVAVRFWTPWCTCSNTCQAKPTTIQWSVTLLLNLKKETSPICCHPWCPPSHSLLISHPLPFPSPLLHSLLLILLSSKSFCTSTNKYTAFFFFILFQFIHFCGEIDGGYHQMFCKLPSVDSHKFLGTLRNCV